MASYEYNIVVEMNCKTGAPSGKVRVRLPEYDYSVNITSPNELRSIDDVSLIKGFEMLLLSKNLPLLENRERNYIIQQLNNQESNQCNLNLIVERFTGFKSFVVDCNTSTVSTGCQSIVSVILSLC